MSGVMISKSAGSLCCGISKQGALLKDVSETRGGAAREIRHECRAYGLGKRPVKSLHEQPKPSPPPHHTLCWLILLMMPSTVEKKHFWPPME